MSDNAHEFVRDVLLGTYRNIIDDDCLGDMMKLMDSWDCHYGHLLVDDVGESNQIIRDCFKQAWMQRLKEKVACVVTDEWLALFDN